MHLLLPLTKGHLSYVATICWQIGWPHYVICISSLPCIHQSLDLHTVCLHTYGSPPLIGTPLLPNNSVLIREVSFGDREHHMYSQHLLPINCVLSRVWEHCILYWGNNGGMPSSDGIPYGLVDFFFSPPPPLRFPSAAKYGILKGQTQWRKPCIDLVF